VPDSGDFLWHGRITGLDGWLAEVGEEGVWTLYRAVLAADGPGLQVAFVRDWEGGHQEEEEEA